MSLFFSEIHCLLHCLLDKIQGFLVKYYIKPEVKYSSGKHIDNQKKIERRVVK